MPFRDLLNDYLARLSSTGRELSEASGISTSVLSRYRSGQQTPDPDSPQLARLIDGIVTLSERKGVAGITREQTTQAFQSCLMTDDAIDREHFRDSLNSLLELFSITGSDLSRYLNYDASYLSRIRSGQRMPKDTTAFAKGVATFLVRHLRSEEDMSLLSSLTGGTVTADMPAASQISAVTHYLLDNASTGRSSGIENFLQKVDAFDLNEYIRAIHFDDMRAPATPFQLPASRFYNGLSEAMEAQLDFLRATVLSKATGPVTMYSDLSMSEMSQNLDFSKKWMFGMALMMKKGLPLNMIHNVDRPFHEMMLGLESFIPLYMTGLISPYCLTGMQSSAFRTMLWVSQAAALQGNCITGHIDDVRLFLTNRAKDLAQYSRQAEHLVKHASPLMDIYTRDKKETFYRFVSSSVRTKGTRSVIFSAPPAALVLEETVLQVMERAHTPAQDREKIVSYIRLERERLEQVLAHSEVSVVLPDLTLQEYERFPMVLPLAGIFYPENLWLTYGEYRSCLEQCQSFAESHPGYSCTMDRGTPFRNIQITIVDREWVLVSKNSSPSIHFVIRHPKMCAAIANMIIPVQD